MHSPSTSTKRADGLLEILIGLWLLGWMLRGLEALFGWDGAWWVRLQQLLVGLWLILAVYWIGRWLVVGLPKGMASLVRRQDSRVLGKAPAESGSRYSRDEA